jgi:hypothetical protein
MISLLELGQYLLDSQLLYLNSTVETKPRQWAETYEL